MAGGGSIKLLISCVSEEFRDYRDQLRRDLTRHNVEVKVQEDFVDFGTATLDKLDRYVASCDAVIHLIGDMTGATAHAESVQAIRARHPDLGERLPALARALASGQPISYTHWEAWLALYHRKRLLIATAHAQAPRASRATGTDEARALQAAHLARLRESHRHPSATFRSPDELAKHILRSAIVDLLAEANTPARKPSTLPYASLGDLFKGREPFMAELRHILGSRAATRAAAITGKALHGLGGVGKTRLAVEYGHRYSSEYTALLFVSAETPQQLNADLAQLVGPVALDLPEQQAREDEARVAAVLAWLNTNPGWLLILDNVDSTDAATAADALLARLAGGHVLITGRLANYGAGVETLELDVLSIDDAAAFLLERTKGRRMPSAEDEEQARSIGNELGHLALALEQAGAYIARHRIALARYLVLWRETRERILEWFDPRVMRYPRSVAVTWATSVTQLSQQSRRLLDRLAWLSPETIPGALLDAAAAQDDASAGEAWPAFDAHEALVGLFDHSLASPAAANTVSDSAAGVQRGFVIHRLVQEVTRRNQAADRPAALKEALAWVQAAFDNGDADDVRAWPVLEPLAPHARAVATFAEERAVDASAAGGVLNRLAILSYAKADFGDAEPLYRRALALWEARYGPDHPEVATTLNNLATLLGDINRRGEAEPLLRRALAIREASLGPDHADVAISLNNLAMHLLDANCHREAEPLLRRALSSWETRYGPEDPHVARALGNLAKLVGETGRSSEAEPLYRRALSIAEKSHGPDHPYVAMALGSLATFLADTNRTDESEPLLRRSLVVLEASYGPIHPHVATALGNLAQMLVDTGRSGEAEPLLRRAMSINEASFGPQHPRLASNLNSLFMLLLDDCGRSDEAELLVRRALAIYEASSGPDHHEVATCLNNLATLLRNTKRFDEAEPLYRRALAIYEVSYGTEHPLVARSLDNLALLLAEANRIDEADQLFRKALRVSLMTMGREHPWTERILARHRSMLHEAGFSESEITAATADEANAPAESGIEGAAS